jgi:hypothetical protein
LARRPEAKMIVLRAEPEWANGDFVLDGRRVSVAPCVSSLAVRSSLAEWTNRRAEGVNDVLVVLCDLADSDLGADVLARFTPPRILGLDPWSAVEQLFEVRHLDGAFRREDGWIADALLEYVRSDVARSMAAGGTLTVDLALEALGRQLLGIERFDVGSALTTSAEPSSFALLADLPERLRIALLGAFAENNGLLGELVAAVLRAGHGAELLAIGLTARSVYGFGELDGGRAAGRLEARCDNQVVPPAVGAALATRAEQVVTGLIESDRDRANVIIAAASTLATQIEAPAIERSDLLPRGFDSRVDEASGTLTMILDQIDAGSLVADSDLLDTLRSQVSAVAKHRESASPAGRLRLTHLQMAARLSTWLGYVPTSNPASSFEDAAIQFAVAGSWIDRARRRLWRGDSDEASGAIYRRVIDAVVARRQVENRQFAELLASWTTTPSPTADLRRRGIVKLEDVLAEVIAPLARSTPVLLVVLDGCGIPSFVELAPQFTDAGFRELGRAGDDQRRLIGVAALPTVTEVSRASLFAGALDRGDAAHERNAFESSAALNGLHAPRLFHQNSVSGPAGLALSAALADALSPAGSSVVAVVINTIDDQLKRGNFTAAHELDDLGPMPWLLNAARTHGRAVVVCADHGHVLAQAPDGGSGEYRGGGCGGERWREADRAPGDGEVLLRGPRVLLSGDTGVVAPWEDDFRYAAKAGGYHGGATPEEVLVPIAVFIPAGLEPPNGWDVWSEAPPLWWDLRAAVKQVDEKSAPIPKREAKSPKKAAAEKPTPLFEVPGDDSEPLSADASVGLSGEPAWIGALLGSEVWKLQRGATGRTPLPEDRIRNVLSALVRRGGVASFAALAADAEVPLVRLAGFLSYLARVLNVDGYAVLDVDAAGQEVRLSTQLLGQQFEITVS